MAKQYLVVEFWIKVIIRMTKNIIIFMNQV